MREDVVMVVVERGLIALGDSGEGALGDDRSQKRSRRHDRDIDEEKLGKRSSRRT